MDPISVHWPPHQDEGKPIVLSMLLFLKAFVFLKRSNISYQTQIHPPIFFYIYLYTLNRTDRGFRITCNKRSLFK